MKPKQHQRDRGETLTTLLLAVTVGSLILAVVASSFATTFQSTTAATTRLNESNDAQLVANYFSNDIQAMVEVSATDCGIALDETRIVGIERGDGSVVAYYENSTETSMVRRVCDSVGTVTESNTVAQGLSNTSPSVACDGGACVAGLVPDEVGITVTEASGFVFDLVGARRYEAGETVASWRLIILGSGPDVVRLDGGAELGLTGDVLITSTSSSWYNGDPLAFSVSGTTTQAVIPDPLAALPHPTAGTLPVYTDGQYHGPGVYRTKQLAFNNSEAVAPGTYILEEGLKLSGSATLTGTEVFLFNGCATDSPVTCSDNGDVDVSGGAAIQLQAPTSGIYKNILYFQSRNNTAAISITGTATVTSIDGTIYAPNSDKLTLGSGSASMQIGAVIAKTIDIVGTAEIEIGS